MQNECNQRNMICFLPAYITPTRVAISFLRIVYTVRVVPVRAASARASRTRIVETLSAGG